MGVALSSEGALAAQELQQQKQKTSLRLAPCTWPALPLRLIAARFPRCQAHVWGCWPAAGAARGKANPSPHDPAGCALLEMACLSSLLCCPESPCSNMSQCLAGCTHLRRLACCWGRRSCRQRTSMPSWWRCCSHSSSSLSGACRPQEPQVSTSDGDECMQSAQLCTTGVMHVCAESWAATATSLGLGPQAQVAQ